MCYITYNTPERCDFMNRGNRTMNDRVDVRGVNLSTILNWYLDGELYINRKYQRKLTWTLQDKKDFIDSLLKNIPVPSMIVASYDLLDDTGEKTGEHRYEIIDGLQRFDAVISFLLNQFSVPILNEDSGKQEEMWFNTEASAKLYSKVKFGEIKPGKNPMDYKYCVNLLDGCQLPISLTSQDSDKIDLIFQRINSKGKKLSSQDLRQSSSCDDFAELVRRISSDIRMDNEFEDFVNLSDIQGISISNYGLDYGIKIDDIFWKWNGILLDDNIRQSRDEELIAKIVAYILIEYPDPGYDTLNRMYDPKNKYNKRLNDEIQKQGLNNLVCRFHDVYLILNNTFKERKTTFSSSLFSEQPASNKSRCFQILFESLYFSVMNGYCVENYKAFEKSLHGIGNTILKAVCVSDKKINKKDWDTYIDSVRNQISKSLVYKHKRKSTRKEVEIEERLSSSPIETPITEFKLGIFDKSGKIGKRVKEGIPLALEAMAHTVSDEVGFLLIGIADARAIRRTELSTNLNEYNYLVYGDHRIYGISREVNVYCSGDPETYLKHVCNIVESSNISTEIKEDVLKTAEIINFKNKQLVLLQVHKIKDSKNRPVRHGVECIRK